MGTVDPGNPGTVRALRKLCAQWRQRAQHCVPNGAIGLAGEVAGAGRCVGANDPAITGALAPTIRFAGGSQQVNGAIDLAMAGSLAPSTRVVGRGTSQGV